MFVLSIGRSDDIYVVSSSCTDQSLLLVEPKDEIT